MIFENATPLFLYPAGLGTFLFLLQGILMVLGLDEGHLDELSFKWLSKQALIGFLMFFGWTGLACQEELGFSFVLSLLCALLGGILSVFLTGSLMKLLRSFKSTGTVFNLENAMGKIGTVYQKIPSEGSGKITLILDGISHEILALSESCEEIASFSKVQVIKKHNENTVIVSKLKG